MARMALLAACGCIPWGAPQREARRAGRRRRVSSRRRSLGDEEQPEGEAGGDEAEPEPLKVEVSNSVMRMLEGKAAGNNAGVSLIEANEKRRKQRQQQQQQQQEDEGFAAALAVKQELFGRIDGMTIPRHDSLFPLLVAMLAVLGDEASEAAEQAAERFNNTSKLRAAAVEDAARLQASSLFCDVHGGPFNTHKEGGKEAMSLERWLLFSMYAKFRLWWKGPSPVAEAALEYAYRISNFVFDDGVEQRLLGCGFVPARRLAIRYGRLFVGRLTEAPASALASIQARLDDAGGGLAAFLLRSGGDAAGEVACLVTHRTSLPFLQLSALPQAASASYLLLAWSASVGFTSASAAWSPPQFNAVVPLGLLAAAGSGALLRRAVAALYGVSHLVSPPLLLPAGQQGAFPGAFVYYRGSLPSRACFFDLSAAASCASIAAAAIFLSQSYGAPSPSDDCVLVPQSVFAFSGLLTALLQQLSVGNSAGDDGTLLVLNPMAVGGLMGLNLALAGLLPISTSDGGRIVSALFGRRVLSIVSSATLALVAASLLVSGKPLLAVSWLLVHSLAPDDSFQRDEVSEPGPVRAVIGLALTFGALLAFFPAQAMQK